MKSCLKCATTPPPSRASPASSADPSQRPTPSGSPAPPADAPHPRPGGALFKHVSFTDNEVDKVFEADDWDRTPCEATRKLSYDDILELKKLQLSLPRAQQHADSSGYLLKHVPIQLMPLLPDQPSPSSPSPASPPLRPQTSAWTPFPTASPRGSSPLSSPSAPLPSALANPPKPRFPLPPRPSSAQVPAPRRKLNFAFMPLLPSDSDCTSATLGAPDPSISSEPPAPVRDAAEVLPPVLVAGDADAITSGPMGGRRPDDERESDHHSSSSKGASSPSSTPALTTCSLASESDAEDPAPTTPHSPAFSLPRTSMDTEPPSAPKLDDDRAASRSPRSRRRFTEQIDRFPSPPRNVPVRTEGSGSTSSTSTSASASQRISPTFAPNSFAELRTPPAPGTLDGAVPAGALALRLGFLSDAIQTPESASSSAGPSPLTAAGSSSASSSAHSAGAGGAMGGYFHAKPRASAIPPHLRAQFGAAPGLSNHALPDSPCVDPMLPPRRPMSDYSASPPVVPVDIPADEPQPSTGANPYFPIMSGVANITSRRQESAEDQAIAATHASAPSMKALPGHLALPPVPPEALLLQALASPSLVPPSPLLLTPGSMPPAARSRFSMPVLALTEQAADPADP